MTEALTGRVVIVTGAGRGLGRAYAMAMAARGASMVVNDLGVAVDGMPSADSPADEVVAKIRDAGGQAIASHHDVSDWTSAGELIEASIEAFGHLDVLVNNAGILRDRTLANVSEREWDDVIRIHLKGHAATSRHAMAYWRAESKGGRRRQASIINTTSVAGLFPNFGQANYAAAKAGIVALTQVAALEGAAYGVRANAISPSAHTRLVPVAGDAAESAVGSAELAPEHVAPLVTWLAAERCPASGQVFQVYGRRVGIYMLTQLTSVLTTAGDWNAEDLERMLKPHFAPLVTAEEILARMAGKT